MSTRCQIIVKSNEVYHQNVLIYRHMDGYPESEHGVVAGLENALLYAWQLPRMDTPDMAAAIVMGFKDNKGAPSISLVDGKVNWRQGGNIYIEGSIEIAPDVWKSEGLHGDEEFLYIVEADKEAEKWQVTVYGKDRNTCRRGYIGQDYKSFKPLVRKKVV